MGRTVLLLASAALAVLFLSVIIGSPPTESQTTPVKPNFVFILTDDMRKDDLKYMPKTRTLLGAQGMQFENAFVSNPLCCPSRATIMRVSTPITRGFGLTATVRMVVGKATRTTATSKTT
jgi:arylsulfatase A-like enzyme